MHGTSQPILELSDVTKRYGASIVLGPISMTLQPGHIYGLAGENGAGKSTLIRLITGLARPSSGTIAIMGTTNGKALNEARRRTGYVPDGGALYPNLSARQNISVRQAEWGLCRGRSADRAEQERLLGLVDLAGAGRKPARSFSLGMIQRLALAIALLGNPDFLILDEPTNGLDPTGVRDMRSLLLSLNRSYGTTMLISSHALGELKNLATDYLILNQGTLIASEPAANLGDPEDYWDRQVLASQARRP